MDKYRTNGGDLWMLVAMTPPMVVSYAAQIRPQVRRFHVRHLSETDTCTICERHCRTRKKIRVRSQVNEKTNHTRSRFVVDMAQARQFVSIMKIIGFATD